MTLLHRIEAAANRLRHAFTPASSAPRRPAPFVLSGAPPRAAAARPVRPASHPISRVDQAAVRAAQSGDGPAMRRALAAGADIDRVLHNGDPLIVHALKASAHNGSDRAFRALLEGQDANGRRANLLQVDRDGNNALHVAAMMGDKYNAKMMLAMQLIRSDGTSHADMHKLLDSRDARGRTPLQVAEGQGHFDVAARIVDYAHRLDYQEHPNSPAAYRALYEVYVPPDRSFAP